MKISVSRSSRALMWVLSVGFVIAGCGGGHSTQGNSEAEPDTLGSDNSLPPAIPEIVSFTASADAITDGESAILEWAVDGADHLSIEPDVGEVSTSSVSVSPSSTTSYQLTAKTGEHSVTSTVDVAVLKGSSDWIVEEKPPTMNNVKFIDVAKLPTTRIAFRDIHCGGLVRKVELTENQDATIYMSGTEALTYPLHVTGGRNVRVVGLQFRLATQPGCGIGELPNAPVKLHPNANIHPRVPGAMALRLQQSGTSFVEGLFIDVMGHQADCIVSRNPDSMTSADARSRRDVVIQNTVCRGVEGMGKTIIGDGVHGDLFQNQGRDVMRRLAFENVSHRTSQEGIVLLGDPKAGVNGAKTLVVRRYDYSWDPRYVGDDKYEMFGSALDGRSDPDWTLENVRILDHPTRNGDYININDQRYGNSPGDSVKRHPEIFSGLPPEGAFAHPEQTGVNYRSPHGGVPAR